VIDMPVVVAWWEASWRFLAFSESFVSMCWCWQDVNVGTSAAQLFNEHINNLSSATRDRLVLQTFAKIDEMFHDSLKPRVDSGVTRAVRTANATVDKWGSKVTSTVLCFIEAVG